MDLRMREKSAAAKPVTSHPVGSGHGSKYGTAAFLSRPVRPSADRLLTCRSGWTSPCWSQCHELHQALGGRI